MTSGSQISLNSLNSLLPLNCDQSLSGWSEGGQAGVAVGVAAGAARSPNKSQLSVLYCWIFQ